MKQGGYSGFIKVIFYSGTIPHFLLFTEEEKAQALSQCKSEKIEITDAYVEHGFDASKILARE